MEGGFKPEVQHVEIEAAHSYVARHINLTLLAPDIVAAILDETLPEGVQLLSLAVNPPMLWEDQRQRAGW